MGAGLQKFYRVTELFTPGKEVVIRIGGHAMVLWVSRLNSFERSEVQKDGSAGRAKRLALMRDSDDEAMIIEQNILEMTREELIGQVVSTRSNEFYLRAIDDIRTDPEWRERMEVIERGDQLARDQANVDEEEIKRIGEINADYLEEIRKREDQLSAEARDEYGAMSEDKLKDAYRDSIKQMLARSAWLEESRISEIFYALRDCNSPVDEFSHEKCNHNKRFVPTRAEVRTLPDSIITVVRDAITDLAMPLREAGNSAAPRSSSASSERQDVAEESQVSTPTET